MPKITSGRRVPSDDCLVPINDESLAIHEGEWVEILDKRAYGELTLLDKFMRMDADLAAALPEPPPPPQEGEEPTPPTPAKPEQIAEYQRLVLIREAAFEQLCGFVADRLMRWTWRDERGRWIVEPNDSYVDDDGVMQPCVDLQKLTQAERRAALEPLTINEIYYLLNVHQLRNPAAEKNGSKPSGTSSSDSVSPPTEEPKSTEGRNRLRAV